MVQTRLPEGTYPYRTVPGKARAFITIIPASAPPPTRTLADGTVHPVYVQPLAVLVAALGGSIGDLIEPLAAHKLHVDLTQWQDVAAEKTGIVIGYSFSPQHPVAPEHRHLFDAWTLTHDTCATITEGVTVREFDGSEPFGFPRE